MKRETEFKIIDFAMKTLMVVMLATLLILLPFVLYRENQTFCTIKTPEFTYENVRKTDTEMGENIVRFRYLNGNVVYSGHYQASCKSK